MTPPDHLLAGLSLGTLYTSFCGIFSLKRLAYIPVIFLCGVFAMLPDADAFRGVYSSTDPFIGHRGITHSLFFVISAASIFTIFYAALRRISGYYFKIPGFDKLKSVWIDLLILLFLSGLSHLLMDLPQPPGVWKGIPLFFPMKNGELYARSGGWGNLGWYDYRITWILFLTVLISLILLSAAVFFKSRDYLRKLLSVCIVITVITAGAMVTDHIKHSVYKGGRDWNESQRRYIEEFPPWMKNTSIKGRLFILGFIN